MDVEVKRFSQSSSIGINFTTARFLYLIDEGFSITYK